MSEMASENYNKRFLDFFKVYIPKSSLHQMKIPNGFLKQFNVLPRNVELRNPMGKVWHLKMGYSDNAVCFLDGWSKFIKDNSIVTGDLLVFRYEGNHIFKVKFFAMSGVEKRENGATECFGSPDIKEEDEEEVGRKGEDDGEIVFDVDNCHGGGSGGSDGSEDYNEEEEMEEEEDTEEEDYAAKPTKKRKGKKIRGNNGESKKRAAVRRRFYDGLKGAEVRKYVQSQNPYFVARSIERKLDLLFVPSYVMKDFGLELPKNITFHDELGRDWPGEVVHWKDGRTLIKGWRAVTRWNHVEKDDCCICEFVEEKGKRGNIISVHILRGVGSRSKARTQKKGG